MALNTLRIRTKNNTSDPLKKSIIVPRGVRAVFRLGSRTATEDIFSARARQENRVIEINTVDACATSGNKLKMKTAFVLAGVPTAKFYTCRREENGFYLFLHEFNQEENDIVMKHYNIIDTDNIKYPIVAKSIGGSQGRGNFKLDTVEQLFTWLDQHVNNLSNFIFEQFYTFSKEYRLHVTSEGCFYTCRKMLKRDTPEELRWQRHDDNSVWILEENEQFAKPNNWRQIEEACVKALTATGLTIGACDVKMQTKLDNPEFIVLEINSAPSMGDITLVKYREQLERLVNG